jgi:hypothetical protein
MAHLLNIQNGFQEQGAACYIKVFVGCQPIEYCRNLIVEEFVQGRIDGTKELQKYDILLMIDDDIVPVRPDLWKMLYQTPDWDVIGAACLAWANSKMMWCGFTIDPGGGFRPSMEILRRVTTVKPQDRQALELDAIGTGCMAVKRHVFEHEAVGGYAPFLSERGDRGEVTVGEDLNFCRKVRAAGFRVFVHTGFECRHFRSDMDLWDVERYSLTRYMVGLEQGRREMRAEIEGGLNVKSEVVSAEELTPPNPPGAPEGIQAKPDAPSEEGIPKENADVDLQAQTV